jgi:hypothetical protein
MSPVQAILRDSGKRRSLGLSSKERLIMNTFGRTLIYSALLAIAAPPLALAAPLTIDEVGAPAVNCVFNTSCIITVNDTVGNFTLTGDSGTGRLQSRAYVGSPGAPANGKNGYDYRIDMTAMHGATAESCVNFMKVNFGTPLTFNYKPGAPAQVFVVTSGGLGSVGPSSATQTGTYITFQFATPVCPGQTSYFFGLAANNAPAPTSIELKTTVVGPPVMVPGRAPSP